MIIKNSPLKVEMVSYKDSYINSETEIKHIRKAKNKFNWK